MGTVVRRQPGGAGLVHYRPQRDAFGEPFDRFAFTARDGVTAAESAAAWVNVAVTPCNDPPVARNVSVVAISGAATVVALNATDVDDALPFSQAYVTSLPTLAGGALLRWDAALNQYVNITAVPIALGAGVATVKYVYAGREDLPLLNADGTFAADAFSFTVTDSSGAQSAPAVASIDVRTALVASPSSVDFDASDSLSSGDPRRKLYSVFEGTPGNVSVFASDLSDDKRAVAVRIVKLPAHGHLVDPATGRRLGNGSRLATASVWPYATPLRITYVGEPHYFNSPGHMYNGTALPLDDGSADPYAGDGSPLVDYGHADNLWFQTELLADPEGRVASRRAAQAVVVINVNDPVRVYGPSGLLATEAIGSSADQGPLVIQGVRLSDTDRDVDPVKVSVECKYGFMDLLKAELDGVDFNSFDLCYGHDDWSCSGDGSGDRSMLFIGQPSAVSRALGSITYKSTYNKVTDVVAVTVWDGEKRSGLIEDQPARSCLEGFDFPTVSRRGPGPFEVECFVAQFNVSIAVGLYAGTDTTVAEESLENNTQLGIAVAVFGLIVALCMTRLAMAKMCGWRLSGIPAEWDSDEASDTDDDFDEFNDDDDDSDGEGGRLTGRKPTQKVERGASARAAGMLRSAVSSAAQFSSTGSFRSQSIELSDRSVSTSFSSGNPLAARAGSVTGPGPEVVELRESVERATRTEGSAGSLEGGELGAVAAARGRAASLAADGGGAQYRFVATDWRRFKDRDGHTYFVHLATGIATYAMPWVLAAADLARPLHEANDPSKWRAVSTGKTRSDGSAIVLYYNKATRQSTFDAPMFATWKQLGDPAAGRQKAKMFT